MALFRIHKGERITHRIAYDGPLVVREGFNQDLSLMKEWNSVYRAVEPHIAGHTILDIGANLGMFSVRALSEFGATHATCFEPEPGAFSVLKYNMKKRSASLFECAIGANNGFVTLHVPASGNANTASTVTTKRGRQLLHVKQRAFCEVVEEIKPTLIKSDCEGAELGWLLGDRLPACVKVVTAELHREERGQPTRCKHVMHSFRKWMAIHKPKSYSYARCWIVSYRR